MAVEAHHLNIFSPQLLGTTREIMNPIGANTNMYNTQMGYGLPLSGTTTENFLPMYNSVIADSIPMKTQIKTESGLTYNLTPQQVLSRKRSREASIVNNSLFSNYFGNYHQSNNVKNTSSCNTSATPLSFLGHDISLQIQQQQLDLDHLVSQHMAKVKMEMEEKRKGQARRIMEAIEEGVMKRLRAKEEEIEKIEKLNWALEEKVKSLCIENQIWRDLAQTNEATANALRTNLEQVLATQTKEGRTDQRFDDVAEATLAGGADVDDAQSGCGSTNGDDGYECDGPALAKSATALSNGRLCKNCRKAESCVLLLPCRHLCLCAICGSSLPTCPICNATKNGSLHVNMS